MRLSQKSSVEICEISVLSLPTCRQVFKSLIICYTKGHREGSELHRENITVISDIFGDSLLLNTFLLISKKPTVLPLGERSTDDLNDYSIDI